MFRSIIFLAAVFLTTTVSAQQFSYTYIQGGLNYVDDRATGLDLDSYGGFVGGSYAIDSNFHLLFNYQEVEFDDVDDIDYSSTELGIGFNASILDSVDFVTTLSWVNAKLDVDGSGSDSDDGVAVDAGFRIWITDYLEFDVGAGLTKLSDSDNDASVSAGLEFYANDNLSIGVSGLWSDSEVATYGLGLRYNF